MGSPPAARFTGVCPSGPRVGGARSRSGYHTLVSLAESQPPDRSHDQEKAISRRFDEGPMNSVRTDRYL